MYIETGTTTTQTVSGTIVLGGAISSSWVTMRVCLYCSHDHDEEQCPRVKEIRYRKNGTIKWVELHAPQPVPYYYPPYDFRSTPTWRESWPMYPSFNPMDTITVCDSGTG